MSNIGKLPIKMPEGVSFELTGSNAFVKGPKGSLSFKLPREVQVENDDGVLKVTPKGQSIRHNAMHGTVRSVLFNMVKGVSDGWTKTLEMVGTGYRAEVQGKNLVLTIGYSHPVVIEAPEEITFEVQKNIIIVSGIDKELVGLIADKIRAVRPPEPYKGKGIKYADEVVRRKAGKAAKAQGAA